MTFEAWLRQWMTRHPLKEAHEMNRNEFTAHVMTLVREEAAAAPAPAPVRSPQPLAWGWPRWSFALAAAAAGIIVAVVTSRMVSTRQVARDIVRHAAILAAFSDGEPLMSSDVDALAVDAAYLVVAEDAPSTDELSWIEQMSSLLNQIDNDSPSTASPDASDGGWQEELEMLDQTDTSVTS